MMLLEPFAVCVCVCIFDLFFFFCIRGMCMRKSTRAHTQTHTQNTELKRFVINWLKSRLGERLCV